MNRFSLRLVSLLGALTLLVDPDLPAADLSPPTSNSASLAALEWKARITRGQAFLAGLLDPELDLLPEFRGSRTYWLFHDNYLAARTLARANPALSRRLEGALSRFGVTNSGKIEILFNEAIQPLPFRTYQLTNVTVRGEKIIRTERVSTQILKGWEDYADLLLLACVAQARSAPGQARRHFSQAANLWDGQGFHDRAARASGIYATYKLALYLIAAERIKLTPPNAPEVLDRLLAQQSKEGGWITDYRKGEPVGLANVETTCLALLALEAQLR